MRYPPPVVPGYVSHFLRFAETGDAKDTAGYTTQTPYGLPLLDADGYPLAYVGRNLYFYSHKAIDGWRDDYRVMVVFGPPVMLDQDNPGAAPVPVVPLVDVDDSYLTSADAKARLAAAGNGTPANVYVSFGAADDATDGGNSEFYFPVFVTFQAQLARLKGGQLLMLPENSLDPTSNPPVLPEDQFGGTPDVVVAEAAAAINSFPFSTSPTDDSLGLDGPHYVGMQVGLNYYAFGEEASYPTLANPIVAVPVRYAALCVPAPELDPAECRAELRLVHIATLDGS